MVIRNVYRLLVEVSSSVELCAVVSEKSIWVLKFLQQTWKCFRVHPWQALC